MAGRFARRVVVFVALVFCFTATGAAGATALRLDWDANPEPNIVQYKVYVGTQSRVYTTVLNAGTQTFLQVSNLISGTNYFFTITAVNAAQLESDFSPEISFLASGSGSNSAPVVANDSFSVAEDTTLTVAAAAGVLFNDLDAEGNPLSAVLGTGPSHGALTLNANGSFTYRASTNYSGPDSFTYRASDGLLTSAFGTVSLTVSSVNDAPIAANEAYATTEDTTLAVSAPGLLGNDTDVDGNTLTAVLVTGPAHGTVTVSANGSFNYRPATNYNGADSFTYRASDGALNSAAATVSLTIAPENDAPVAVTETYIATEDTTLTVAAPGVLGNDSDPDGNSISAVLLDEPSHGTLTLNPNGSFIYVPVTNYSGPDSFNYFARDGVLDSTVITVTISVGGVNEAPVAVNDTFAGTEDTLLTVAAPGLLGNDTDVDGSTLFALLVTSPAAGTLTFNTNGSFTYRPATNYNGPVTFTYRTKDLSLTSAVATVTLTLNPANDAPLATNNSYTLAEDTTLTLPAPGLLGNDGDVDGDPLIALLVSSPAHGTLTLNANGSFSYLPDANYTGLDSFSYQASDGSLNSTAATVAFTVTAANDAPVSVAEAYTANEDTTLSVVAPGVLSNDIDPEGSALTATVVTAPAHGTLTLNANGSFTYRATTNYYGPDSFVYRASDGTNNSANTTVSITVNAVNDAPTVVNETYSTAEETVLTVAAPGVLSNDTDTDGDSLTALVVTAPTHGTLNLNANGSFTYVPVTNFSGTDFFTYRASDGALNSGVATVTLTVTAVNDAPVAVADSFTATEDVTLTVAAPGVLDNDADTEGTALTAALVVSPAHGTLTLNVNGSFTYRAATNYSGPDSFTYRASDGAINSAVTTVSISVNAVNDAPVATGDGYTVVENTPLIIAAAGVLSNDTDSDGDPLTAVLVVNPTHGTLSLNANGSFTYVPVTNYNGADSFTYRASDGTLNSALTTVTLSVSAVNDAPIAANDSYSTAEDTQLSVSAPGVLGNDSDADGNTLSVTLLSGPTQGTLTLNPNGSFTYRPATNYNGADSFTYRASDGSLNSGGATVSLNVSVVNDAPLAGADSYATTEDVTLTVNAPGLLANDSDLEGSALNATLVTGPAHGSLTLNANGSFTFVPTANYSGPDSFIYRASDGAANSANTTVTLTINAVNDAPVAANDAYTATEDTLLSITTPGVLGNDSDADGTALTATLVSGPAHGTLTLNANGSFTYRPATNYSGPDSFTYTASDGALSSGVATVALTVNGVNETPVAGNDGYSTAEDTVLNVTAPGLLANDTDPDGNSLTVVLVTSPAQGALTLNGNGSFTYVPATNYSGTVSFTYRATDGTLNSTVATVSLTVTAVNDVPVAAADTYATTEDTTLTVGSPGVLGNDADTEGTALTAALVTGPANGTLTLNANGSFTYRPATNYNGPDSFIYRASDGANNSANTTVSITVNAVNDAPVATADAYAAVENTPLIVAAAGVLSNDTDPDGNPLNAVLISNPAHGTITLNASGAFTYVPVTNYSGPDSFTYRASDGTLNSASVSVTLSISAVNDAPIAANDSYSIAEDTLLSVSAPGVLGNDSDADGNTLSVTLLSGPTQGTLSLNANGSFTYRPATNYNGADSFTYRASDGSLNSGVATVSLNVSVVNDAPLAGADSYATTEDTTLTVNAPGLLANDSDAEGSPLTVTLVTGAAHGSLTLNANGSFTFVPTANYSGPDSFTYRASDGAANSANTTVALTINAVNDAPVAAGDAYTAVENTPLVVSAPGVLSNDSDADGDTLSVVLVTNPTQGTLTLNANGSFTYVPTTNFGGADSFTYRASDGSLNSALVTVALSVSAVNDAPVVANDSYSTAEDTTLTVSAPGVLANDTDADGNTLSVTVVASPTHGTLTLNVNGSFTYRPATNYNGPDAFSYRASDGTLNSGLGNVSLNVTLVNDTPLAGSDNYSPLEDTTLTINPPGVLANDTDAEGGLLTAELVVGPAHGTLTLNANGSFSYRAATNYSGPDSFTYRASDGTTTSALTTVSLSVSAVNDAPLASGDAYTAVENTPLVVGAAGVLSNDTDSDGDPITATLVASPAHGTLTLNANGAFTFVPVTNYNGADSFTYRASDGTLNSALTTVTLSISAVNDAPIAASDSYSTAEDTLLSVSAPGVLGNDSDADGNTLSVTLLSGPTQGTLTLNANGSFTYRPATNYNGPDSFTYRASDGSLNSGIATVALNVSVVNDTPLAGSDSYSTTEDVTLTVNAPGLLANDSDAEGSPLTVTLVTGPAHGALTLNANGSFTFVPTANYSGPDSFVYRASDGAANSANTTVALTINAVNDAPVAVNDAYTATEDILLAISAPGVLGNDSDADGNTLSVTLLSGPTQGTLTLNANGSFTYRPATNYNGPDSFTYTVSDGTVSSGLATVSLTVGGVNEAPVAANDSYSTTEDTTLAVTAPGLLANDSDPDGNSLTVTLVTSPAHGTLSLNGNGSFNYVPAANYNGADSFTYRVSDGTLNSGVATVSLTITAVNDVPVAIADSYAITEDTTLTSSAPGVLGNDSDAEGSVLTAVLATGPAHGTLSLNANGSFTFVPTPNYSGPDSFTYRASDGTTNSALTTVTVTITTVNDAPVAAGDSYAAVENTPLIVAAAGVLSNDTDSDGDPLTAVLVVNPTHGTLSLNANGSFTYVPVTNYNGADSFTYRASDGSLNSSSVSVTLSISAVNDAPIAANDSYSTAEDTLLSVSAPGVLGNDSDADGNTLSVTLLSGPTQGTLTLNANGSFTYRPATNYNGADSFTYRASDGSLNSGIATVALNVSVVNDAPLAGADSYATTEDVTLTVNAPGLLANDSDLEGSALNATLVTGPTHGSLTLNANGSFTFVPTANYSGPDSFVYRTSDGSLNSANTTVALTINAVNDAPVAVNDAYTATEDTLLSITTPGVLGNDSDAEGTALTATLVSGPAHGTLTLNANGSFNYVPATDYNGPDSFTYTVSDGALSSSAATVSFNVGGVNEAPVAVADSFSIAEDTTLAVTSSGLLANDTDPDGNSLTAALVTSPAHGTLTLNGNGSFNYVPATNYNGPDSFTYRVSDGTLNSPVATVSLNLTPVNDPPGAANNSHSGGRNKKVTSSVLVNATDPEGDALVAVLVNSPAHGAVTLSAGGAFEYLAVTNYVGSDSFTYRVSDGQLTSPDATVFLTITADNDEPIFANGDSNYFTLQNMTLVLPASGGVLTNDISSNPLTAVLLTTTTHGTLTLNADGGFTYVPQTDFLGLDTFYYYATDGAVTSTVATVTIAVAPEGVPPVVANDSFTVEANSAFSSDAPGVLANDIEMNGGALQAVLETPAAHGDVLLNADGSFFYSPAADYAGEDTFTYRAFYGPQISGLAVVTITVLSTNNTGAALTNIFTELQATTTMWGGSDLKIRAARRALASLPATVTQAAADYYAVARASRVSNSPELSAKGREVGDYLTLQLQLTVNLLSTQLLVVVPSIYTTRATNALLVAQSLLTDIGPTGDLLDRAKTLNSVISQAGKAALAIKSGSLAPASVAGRAVGIRTTAPRSWKSYRRIHFDSSRFIIEDLNGVMVTGGTYQYVRTKHNGATLSLVFDNQPDLPFNCKLTFTTRSTMISGSGVRGSISFK